jgi:hypothetical protein
MERHHEYSGTIARGREVNYPGNPQFRPHIAHKLLDTTDDMNQRKEMMINHVVVVIDDGLMGVPS